ncbi:MAG: hypothetical protein IT260_09695 [Saprospiraceae bacterium]|nr:hypothetical protein [Saprospiraceae bacterium]
MLFPIVSLALAGLCCFSFFKPAAAGDTEPTTIVLEDNELSISLSCTKSGGAWVVTQGSAAAYLSQVGSALNQGVSTSYQGIQLVFAADYSSGSLSGYATNPTGNRVPVGVEYVRNVQNGDVVVFKDDKKHTCTGAPCSCCDFVKDDSGGIKGCKCLGENDCHITADNQCNHVVEDSQ